MKAIRMSNVFLRPIILFATFSVAVSPHTLSANDLIKTGERVAVAKSQMTVTPPRDWNKLSQRVGKKAETWTLDGERLNDISFFANIAPGEPLLRERSKKHDPLPKLQPNSLLTDIPEFLEGTYRSYHGLAVFNLGSSSPAKFMGEPAVRFSYEYVTPDELTRKGEAIATLRNGSLFMITFDAPKLHYFERNIEDYRALVATAAMN
jgi:hypothetical protein